MVRTLHVHDLILLRTESAVTSTQGEPACPYLNPNERPWMVVRRGRISDGLIPVGVRGSQRHERCSAFTRLIEVFETRQPDQLRLLLAEDSRGNTGVPNLVLSRKPPHRIGYELGSGRECGL
jgi:phosphoribosyl-dephospho-CoA transferase